MCHNHKNQNKQLNNKHLEKIQLYILTYVMYKTCVIEHVNE